MDCPECDTEFDWDDGTCPSCGWTKDEQSDSLRAPWEDGDPRKTSRSEGLLSRIKRYF